MPTYDSRPDRGTRQIALASAHPSAVEVCLRAIERIEEVIEQETRVLARNEAIDLEEFSRRKSHGLLDLTRGMRGLDPVALRQALEPRLRPLRAKLAENNAALKRHLDAVQEVSSIMARAIREGESDGTYSSAIRFDGAKR